MNFRLILTLSLALLMSVSLTTSQIMQIHTEDGVESYNLADIDSITFTEEGQRRQQDFNPFEDAETWQARPDDNFNGTMWVGRWDDGAQRAHMNFCLLDSIPRGAFVINATLRMYIYQDIYGSFPIFVGYILEEWHAEELTWNNQPTISERGVERDSPRSRGWNEFDITEVVQQIVNSETEYGVGIRKSNENEGHNVSFGIIQSESDTPPVLHVEWSQ
ncbi:DNRLRE domain-containing protein [bacterium]|nr:DNRLRE domain-containing protein [bacterium]